MAIVHVTKVNFNQVVKTNGVVLLDFWAPWCGPCKMISPVLDEIEGMNTGAVIAKCNVDEAGDVAQQNGVMSVPTILVFKNGVIVDKVVGFKPKEFFVSLIQKHR